MIKHIFRNLVHFKGATFLNVVGLSSALAVFIIISMQIRYELTYDKHHKDYDLIYQLAKTNITTGETFGNWDRPSINRIKDGNYPEIKHISLLGESFEQIITLLKDDGEDIGFREIIYTCEDDFLKVFTFEFIEGDESVLKDWSNIIVSDAFAKKYYGDNSPLGQFIENGEEVYIIAAVYKAFPENSTLQGNLFINIGNENINSHNNMNYDLFLLAGKKITAKEFDRKIFGSLQPEVLPNERSIYINPVELTEIRNVMGKENSYAVSVMILLVVSILTLALINFVNFYISMIPLKIKGILLRKVVGVSDNKLRLIVIVEALCLMLISFIVAIFLVELFKRSDLSSIIFDMSWKNNELIYYITFGISILVGIFAGIYPAIYSTSFSPALVLKSSFALSAKGRLFRKYLIVFQFLVAIVFIAIALFIQLQYNHLITKDGGYNKDGVLHIYHGFSYDKYDALKPELLAHPDIKDVTFSWCPFGVGEDSEVMNWGRPYLEEVCYIDPVFVVAYNFLDFFEIDILEGRDFMPSDKLTENGCWVMSKSLMDRYEIDINDKLGGNRGPADILGVCENTNGTNMKEIIRTPGFYVYDGYPLDNCYVKFSGNPEGVIKHINESYKATDPNSFITIEFMDDELKAAYAAEEKQKKIMQSLSLIAIVIALLGVYGLVAFDTRFRRKEISLRKINGASVSDVLAMFSVAYLKIVVISFVISIPIIFVVVRDWLSAFPYKIPIYWWVFVLAFLFVALLTLAISLVQTYTAARENPIKQLKEN